MTSPKGSKADGDKGVVEMVRLKEGERMMAKGEKVVEYGGLGRLGESGSESGSESVSEDGDR